MNTFKIFLICGIAVFILAPDVTAQTKQNIGINAPSEGHIISSAAIELRLTKEEPDQRGTNVENIYTITVDFADPDRNDGQSYWIHYSLDGQRIEIFKNQQLPFSLKRNFRGQLSGEHEIKIELEDPVADIVVASKTITVTVTHNQ